jgi:hypothetical protein
MENVTLQVLVRLSSHKCYLSTLLSGGVQEVIVTKTEP